ncbi:MAG: hypothetical protein LIO37_00385 [Clostridiales bacterium]|nr:hypothetical protein [Clostridiales bacterium]
MNYKRGLQNKGNAWYTVKVKELEPTGEQRFATFTHAEHTVKVKELEPTGEQRFATFTHAGHTVKVAIIYGTGDGEWMADIRI